MKKAFTIAALACIGGIFIGIVWPSWRVIRSFDNLESNAKKAVTATELQIWATNLLVQYPTYTTLSLSQLGTNFPAQLRGLAPKLGPWIVVFEGPDTNSSSWVYVRWGSGFLGSKGFEIGPTNFISYRSNARAWQPGVWFWSDNPPR